MTNLDTVEQAATQEAGRISNFMRLSHGNLCAWLLQVRSNLKMLSMHRDLSEDYYFRETQRSVDQMEDALVGAHDVSGWLEMSHERSVSAFKGAYAELKASYPASKEHAINDPAVRSEVLALTGGRCAYCDCELEQGTGTTETFTVEHIVPRESGGPDNIANYVPACKSCNCSKGTGHVITFIKRRVSLAAGVRPELRLVPTEIAGG